MNQILRKLGWMAQRSRKEAELRDELQFHLQEEAEQAEAAGLTAEEAKYAARRELGNVALLMEDTRAAWGWTCLERFWQDLRYAGRTLRKNPGFAAAAILVAGARDRRQYGDFQLAQCRSSSGRCRWPIRSSSCSSQIRFRCGKPAATATGLFSATRSSSVFKRNRRHSPAFSAGRARAP